ncbi:DUF2521 family protein [Priestia flexa]|uniref:DUF2521 family protein n=1 Tax=Priestia flexa TaxID=86664 RepID=UPI001B31B409|nr:DUF2521 family protein [Priestia flexa]
MYEANTFKEKRYEREMKYERKVLRDLSIEELHRKADKTFRPIFQWHVMSEYHVEEYCMDIAIESFLLGARTSKFFTWGETLEQSKLRSVNEEKLLADTLFEVLCSASNEVSKDSLYYLCQSYVEEWWNEGYETGIRRHRLRLS